jgi:Zn-dependent M32 family carboxypeptidase
MTYPAHVILRFSLEQVLITGALQVSDLPGRPERRHAVAVEHRAAR